MYKKLQYQLQNSCNLTGQSHESPPMRGEGGQKSLKLNDIISDSLLSKIKKIYIYNFNIFIKIKIFNIYSIYSYFQI